MLLPRGCPEVASGEIVQKMTKDAEKS